jgi:hypothetical protein
VALVAVVAIAGLSTAALQFLRAPSPAHPSTKPTSSPSHHGGTPAAVLTPVGAQGFDALRTRTQDPSDENSTMAVNLIDHDPAGWATQQYLGSPNFGNLKSGSGLILNMGEPVQISSVTITFGDMPGANVELKEGDSNTRSVANEESMVTVASMSDVSGTRTFKISKPVTDQYLVVWFTRLPPLRHVPGKWMAQIFNIIIRGTD